MVKIPLETAKGGIMDKFSKKVVIISVVTVLIAVTLVLVTFWYALSQRNETPTSEPWVLQTYGNNVALYNGDEVIEVYGAIMIDTLPAEDKRLLDNGISFLTREEAVMAIEDYDG